jgi:DNA-nicking Smr family endonuclease
VTERAHTLGEPTLDLHGLSAREAPRRADAFLRAEQARGTVSVRILTSQLSGVLKQAVGALLQGHASVASVTVPVQSDAALLVVLRAPARGAH